MGKIVFSLSVGVLTTLLIVIGTVSGQTPPAGPPPMTPPTFQPPPPPPTPCPRIGCPTATPTPTPTPIPLTLGVALAHRTVNPRSKQKVTITTLPGTSLTIRVRFPNGNTLSRDATAGASGKLTWSFVQPGSRITHASRTAKVTVLASNASDAKSSTKRYSVGFARLDISIQPRTQSHGRAVGVWLHTGAATPVELVLRFHGGKSQSLVINGRSAGWSDTPYSIPGNAPRGAVDVKGYNLARSYPGSAETSFRVT